MTASQPETERPVRNALTTVLDLAGFSAIVYGGFLLSPVVGWFTLGAVVLFASWTFSE